MRHLESLNTEALARWAYATGTAIAATSITLEIGDTMKATLLALAHVAAAALVAYARRPRTVRIRRKPRRAVRRLNSTGARGQKPCQPRKK